MNLWPLKKEIQEDLKFSDLLNNNYISKSYHSHDNDRNHIQEGNIPEGIDYNEDKKHVSKEENKKTYFCNALESI